MGRVMKDWELVKIVGPVWPSSSGGETNLLQLYLLQSLIYESGEKYPKHNKSKNSKLNQ